MLGFTHCLDARFGWKDTFEIAMAKARTYVDRALELDPENADAYITSGMVLLMEGRHDEAVAIARKAVRLAPGSADVAQLAALFSRPRDTRKKRPRWSRRRWRSVQTIPRCIWACWAMPSPSRAYR